MGPFQSTQLQGERSIEDDCLPVTRSSQAAAAARSASMCANLCSSHQDGSSTIRVQWLGEHEDIIDLVPRSNVCWVVWKLCLRFEHNCRPPHIAWTTTAGARHSSRPARKACCHARLAKARMEIGKGTAKRPTLYSSRLLLCNAHQRSDCLPTCGCSLCVWTTASGRSAKHLLFVGCEQLRTLNA